MSEFSPRPYFIWIKIFDTKAENNNVETAAIPVESSRIFGLADARFIDRPPRYANAERTCFWTGDKWFDGVKSSGLKLDYSPHTGTREEAVNWLESKAGNKWLAGALSFELMSFTTL